MRTTRRPSCSRSRTPSTHCSTSPPSSASACASAIAWTTSTAGSRSARSLMLFSSLHLVFTPLLGTVAVSPGDFLRVLGYGVLCRRLARDQRGRVRTRGRGGALAPRARDPRRARAVPVRALDARDDARAGRAAAQIVPQIKQRRHRRAAGGALCDPRALLRGRQRTVRRGAAALRRSLDRRRRARGRARDRPADAPRRRTSRSNCSGSSRKGSRTSARHARARRAEVRIEQRDGRRLVTIVDDGEGFDARRRRRRPGPSQHSRAHRVDRGGACIADVARRGHGARGHAARLIRLRARASLPRGAHRTPSTKRIMKRALVAAEAARGSAPPEYLPASASRPRPPPWPADRRRGS